MNILNHITYSLGDYLAEPFFQNAILGSLLASITCGIIGTYIVVRRLVFVSGGITHASMGGLGIGFYLGVNPILAALIFSIFSAFGIEWLSSRQGVREDSAIGTFWSLGMAIGIIFMYMKPGYAPNITDYLFGNVLTITSMDILYLAAFSLIVIAVFVILRRPILFMSFDPDFAKTRNLPVTALKYLMMLFIATTIVLSIRLVGIVLLMSILTVPQMTANLYTSNFNKMILLSILIGAIGCLLGLYLSVVLNVPSGVFIIFVQILLFLLSKLVLMFLERRRQLAA